MLKKQDAHPGVFYVALDTPYHQAKGIVGDLVEVHWYTRLVEGVFARTLTGEWLYYFANQIELKE